MLPRREGGRYGEREKWVVKFPPSTGFPYKLVSNSTTVQIFLLVQVFSGLFTYLPQGRHLRRPGEEESDVDIEGFEEEDDGKPKTPAPVRQMQIVFEFSMSYPF